MWEKKKISNLAHEMRASKDYKTCAKNKQKLHHRQIDAKLKITNPKKKAKYIDLQMSHPHLSSHHPKTAIASTTTPHLIRVLSKHLPALGRKLIAAILRSHIILLLIANARSSQHQSIASQHTGRLIYLLILRFLFLLLIIFNLLLLQFNLLIQRVQLII